MFRSTRSALAISFGVAMVLWASVFHESLLSIVHTWNTNASFSHGFLIVPISIWLVWRKRNLLPSVPWRPSWVGLAALFALSLAWVVGRGAGALAIEQFAVGAMVPMLALAVAGVPMVRLLAMPLLYLMLAVPVGYALVPWLMHMTADVATWALKLSGVPVHRSDMYISVPGGKFEVARACSGLNYFVTGLALGALYSYLTYRGWRKRVLSVLAFVVVPIVANGLRVYFTILVSYLTDMRFGPGDEHVWFGRAFFILVVFMMFWVGRRWHDDDVPSEVNAAQMVAQPGLSMLDWLPVVGAWFALLAGPMYLSSILDRVEARLDQERERLQLMQGGHGWDGPLASADGWKPMYSGAIVERSGVYRDAAGAMVDAFVGVYSIGTSGGTEMISYKNRIFSDEHRSLGSSRLRSVGVPGQAPLMLCEEVLSEEHDRRLVWYWFMVGDRRLTDRYSVKAYEALSMLVGGAVTERIVTLSTPIDGGEVSRLENFVASHAKCVTAGFAYEACEQ